LPPRHFFISGREVERDLVLGERRSRKALRLRQGIERSGRAQWKNNRGPYFAIAA
jgi:hypothetical protein